MRGNYFPSMANFTEIEIANRLATRTELNCEKDPNVNQGGNYRNIAPPLLKLTSAGGEAVYGRSGLDVLHKFSRRGGWDEKSG